MTFRERVYTWQCEKRGYVQKFGWTSKVFTFSSKILFSDLEVISIQPSHISTDVRGSRQGDSNKNRSSVRCLVVLNATQK